MKKCQRVTVMNTAETTCACGGGATVQDCAVVSGKGLGHLQSVAGSRLRLQGKGTEPERASAFPVRAYS